MQARLKSIEELLAQIFSGLPLAQRQPGSEKETKSGLRFPKEEFFEEWFRKNGKVYFFLFKKNLKVTNLQAVELIALVQSHLYENNADQDNVEHVQFFSIEDFNNVLARLVEGFELGASRSFDFEFIAREYSHLLANALVVDVLFGSCVVFVPPYLDLDLKTICFLSGYIHSCGPSIYIRNVYKATPEEFFLYLGQHLKTLKPEKKLFFRPYVHEDFTEFDRDQKDELRSGLDDVKLYAQKYYVGTKPISSLIEDMRKEFADQLQLPAPGGNFTIDDLSKETPGIDPTRTLFLIMDHSLGDIRNRPGDRHFLICYEQLLLNENPFHIFDENKPAWFDHTTMPHTLMGAMLNITRPYWPKNRKVRVADFFLGSGTAWLETLKYPNISFNGLDIEPISALLAEDNLCFFSEDDAATSEHERRLALVFEYLRAPKDRVEQYRWMASTEGLALEWARNFLDGHLKDRSIENLTIDASDVETLRGVGVLNRLLFYALLRAARRYSAALKHDVMKIEEALTFQVNELRQQFKRLASVKKRIHANSAADGARTIFTGKYSLATSLNLKYLRGIWNEKGFSSRLKIGDLREAQMDDKVDVVITDPPYGFNALDNETDRTNLANLYCRAVEFMIDALAPEGQLIFALPDWSHTGKHLPVFTQKDFVVQQVLLTAHKLKKEVFTTAIQIPRSHVQHEPPYYWESERALRRAVLHFRFRDLSPVEMSVK